MNKHDVTFLARDLMSDHHETLHEPELCFGPTRMVLKKAASQIGHEDLK